jgi:hypothetical protein
MNHHGLWNNKIQWSSYLCGPINDAMQLYSFPCPNQGLVSEQDLLGTFPKFGTLVFLVGS